MILNPLRIKNIKLLNRVVISPMCQYSSNNGNPTDWHYEHLLKLSRTGAGLMMIESTAVNKIGRITYKDLMLSNKENEENLKKLVKFIKKKSKIRIGIQISHSGRKGSSEIPWIKSNTSLKKKPWKTVAPSPIKRYKGWPVPKELSIKEILKIINDFKNSAIRANKANLDCLEIHMAHGYLLHQFFSKISNKRKDKYGGSLKNRSRFLLEVSKAVRNVWPKNKILGARVTGSDWMKGGISTGDTIYLIKFLKAIGFDYVCVSSGGIIPKTKLVFREGYNVKFAKQIRRKTGIITRVGGMINNFNYANKLIKFKNVDLIANARKFINEPNWLIKEIVKRKKNRNIVLNQYKRCF
tara:strand:+ start:181 stop:1239 length:1059 start_codon:yes stop_codon:yes gene_type:complete